jgi:DNA-binding transcriptional ArsR family regulator
MSTRDQILETIRRRRRVTGRELTELLGISRQAVHLHLKALIERGAVLREGRTRGAVYRASAGKKKAPAASFRRRYRLAGLEEHEVYRELEAFLGLARALSPAAREVARYSFTEMLNNAIDHSRSTYGNVEAAVGDYSFRFRVRDHGQGAFHTIAAKFALPDEAAAVGELLKGKTTTMKEKHTGEGIFFTSKVADRFTLRSHRIELTFDNLAPDIVVAEKRSLRGTEAAFEISRRSRRTLAEVFAAFAPEEFDYRFEKTRVHVRLYRDAAVSRSEARRMLHGLDRFREIVLDFEGVKAVGQGFADEVFRIFRRDHPATEIRVVNLSPSLEPALRHVLDNKI